MSKKKFYEGQVVTKVRQNLLKEEDDRKEGDLLFTQAKWHFALQQPE